MQRFSFLLLAFLCSIVQLSAQTIVTIDTTTTNPNPTPFGLNWAESNQARNLNALNNQTGDPGFGRQIIRHKGTLAGGSTTEAVPSNIDNYETLYTGMFDGGNVRIYRETANGITLVRSSTVINFFADTLVANHKRITFAAGPAVQAGDIYVISRESTSDLNEFCHPRLTWIRDGANTWGKKV